MSTLLTSNTNTDSKEIKSFFDKFYVNEVTFPSAEIDAVVGFFQRRNFDNSSSQAIAIILLNQARDDNVNVFTMLETFKSLTTIHLNQIVAEVLNSYRGSTNLIGYRVYTPDNEYESRNILI